LCAVTVPFKPHTHIRLFSNKQPDSTQKKSLPFTAEKHAVTLFTVDDSSRMIHAKKGKVPPITGHEEPEVE